MKQRVLALLHPRNEYRLIGLMLLLLHAAVWLDFGGALSRSLMLVQFGLFLVWQPVVNRDLRMTRTSAAIFLVAALVLVVWFNWWLMVFWVLLLSGLVGGRILTTRRDRYAYMTVLVFLVIELLIGCLPEMFSISFRAPEVPTVFAQVLLAIPLGLLLLPAPPRGGKQPYATDFLYGLTVSLLIGILALGGLLSMYATGADYPVALLQTVLGLALFLLAISWLWMPLAGFSGLGQVWERYLLNIGTPFEQWLGELARLAETHQQPATFLDAAMHQLGDLPWVAGVSWETATERGELGLQRQPGQQIAAGELHATLHTQRPMGTALMLHARLLVQLVAHFHNEKLREQELTQRAHLQAVYETGARVTHDIKNLLQSMHTMSSALEHSAGSQRRDAERLLQRQLPHLTQRLRLALDKLQTPQDAATDRVAASVWWASLKARHAGLAVVFGQRIDADRLLPADCFDSVAANLIENALAKQQTEPGVQVSATLECTAELVCLRVCDTGSAVDPETASGLFRAPVSSRNGLGIGLYQAARHAGQLGYRLLLAHNLSGRVCFELVDRVTEATEEQVPT